MLPPPPVADDKPDENGITETMLDFSWERDIEPSVRLAHLYRLSFMCAYSVIDS